MWKRTAFVFLFLATSCAALQTSRPTRLVHSYDSFTTDALTVKNLNTDPNGEPWIVGGLILPSAREFAAFPRLVSSPVRQSPSQLPERVDNSKQKYWRGIFAQKDGSCAQASAIGYVYTYEVNRMRGRNANNPHDRYPTHWTYNFVNNGYDRGSWMMWGWDVGKSLGIASVKAYGTETGYDLQYWPSDYAVYENALDNKVDNYFVMEVNTPIGIENLKRYLYDHGSDGGEGGIFSFAAGWSTGYKEVKLPEGSYEAGKKMITSFGSVVNHAVTFVGYDEKVCYDVNQDGRCTNDLDIDGDKKVTVADWEVGALIMANSWGTGWGDEGFVYVPYRLCALPYTKGGIYLGAVYGVTPQPDREKGMVLRVRMTHDKRSQLRFISSYKSDVSENKDFYRYYGLQNSGGDYPLNGKTNAAVTFGLDLRDLLGNADTNRIDAVDFVLDSLGGVGTIETVEVLDYETGRVVQSTQQNIDIAQGRTTASVDWKEDPEPDPDPEPCRVGPIALAGYDLVVSEYCVQVLDGSASFDLDGKIVSYAWRQTAGPQKLQLENADTPKVKVYFPRVQKTELYSFSLTVKDADGFAKSDSVSVKVKKR